MVLFGAAGFAAQKLLGWSGGAMVGLLAGLVVAPMVPAPGAACGVRKGPTD